jgi:hypothetical protein
MSYGVRSTLDNTSNRGARCPVKYLVPARSAGNAPPNQRPLFRVSESRRCLCGGLQ